MFVSYIIPHTHTGHNLIVKLQVGSQSTLSPTTFSYARPYIQSVSPSRVPILSNPSLDISGSNFGYNISAIQVVISKKSTLINTLRTPTTPPTTTPITTPITSLPSDLCSSKVLVQNNKLLLCIAVEHDRAEKINLVCVLYMYVCMYVCMYHT